MFFINLMRIKKESLWKHYNLLSKLLESLNLRVLKIFNLSIQWQSFTQRLRIDEKRAIELLILFVNLTFFNSIINYFLKVVSVKLIIIEKKVLCLIEISFDFLINKKLNKYLASLENKVHNWLFIPKTLLKKFQLLKR